MGKLRQGMVAHRLGMEQLPRVDTGLHSRDMARWGTDKERLASSKHRYSSWLGRRGIAQAIIKQVMDTTLPRGVRITNGRDTDGKLVRGTCGVRHAVVVCGVQIPQSMALRAAVQASPEDTGRRVSICDVWNTVCRLTSACTGMCGCVGWRRLWNYCKSRKNLGMIR